MTKSPHQWYSSLKRLTAHDQHKSEPLHVEEISQYSDQEQAEMIAKHKAKIANQYEKLELSDIKIPQFSPNEITQFPPSMVWLELTKLQTNKSTRQGDLPPKLWKLFAAYFAEPLTDIINTSLRTGQYPMIYKFDVQTPVAKVRPCLRLDQIRNISGLLTPDKVMESLISQLMISDMEDKMDPSQYGNQKGVSLQHYLIKMIHRILSAVDNNTKIETFAVVANLIDWKQAFSQQCPKLGIISFMENNVRSSLIPLLANYFQDRVMIVKHHGVTSVPRELNGGGPEGGTLGILEYLSQSNKNADCVRPNDRFKFVDDLTALEIVNLLTVGLTSFNVKHQVPTDLPEHGQYIPAENLKSQDYLNEIQNWTKNQKMVINETKTKTMIFNFTRNYQFSTRLQLNNVNLEVVNETKLLGTIVSDDLKWEKNTAAIVKKSYARMQLLRKVKSFNPPINQLKTIYTTFVRSVAEQSCTVWNSMLTQENIEDLERIQKCALKIILENKYEDYNSALNKMELTTLQERREELCKTFAFKCVTNVKTKMLFQLNTKTHEMITRNPEKYDTHFAHKERLLKSPVIYMQKLLNIETK